MTDFEFGVIDAGLRVMGHTLQKMDLAGYSRHLEQMVEREDLGELTKAAHQRRVQRRQRLMVAVEFYRQTFAALVTEEALEVLGGGDASFNADAVATESP